MKRDPRRTASESPILANAPVPRGPGVPPASPSGVSPDSPTPAAHPPPGPLPRPYQSEVRRAFARSDLRLFCLLWERQSGKSSTLADLSLYEMIHCPGRTCIYASASLLLAQDLLLKQSQRLDALRNASDTFLRLARHGVAIAAHAGLLFQTADTHSNQIIPHPIPSDLFAALFQAQKLEFRVYHSRTAYSRTKIIAPNLATARSWTGTVFLDEIAFIPQLKPLLVALLPVISTNPHFKLILATTPPEFDDSHYSFELLAPPPDLKFTPNPAGNWYEGQSGIRVHRADAFDTFLAGKKIFHPRSGREITPDQALRAAPNQLGHRIAHLLAWVPGGSAACDLLRLSAAQQRGIDSCAFFDLDSHAAFLTALHWLARHLHPAAPIALGFDPATTTKGSSNPSALALAEYHPPNVTIRALLIWKTRDPDIARERLTSVLDTLSRRPGPRPRALAIDATNEKYFAEDLHRQFAPLLPVLLVVASESVHRPGLEKTTNWKEFLGDQYLALLHDNHLTLPPDAYVRADHRLVLRDRGRFVCEPDTLGRHGDTFDAAKLALHALTDSSGALASLAGIYYGPNDPLRHLPPRGPWR